MPKSLDELLKESAAAFAKLTPEEQEAVFKRQREGVVRAEMSWPKPRFRIVNGVKIYESYEDYCNG